MKILNASLDRWHNYIVCKIWLIDNKIEIISRRLSVRVQQADRQISMAIALDKTDSIILDKQNKNCTYDKDTVQYIGTLH
jgi:hypothetical protein